MSAVIRYDHAYTRARLRASARITAVRGENYCGGAASAVSQPAHLLDEITGR